MKTKKGPTELQKGKFSRPSKKSDALRQHILIASGFLTLGFKFVRLIEELLKMFKP
jgi:hypothetical protein